MMKKAYFLGRVALVILALMGCPGGDDDTKGDGKDLPSGWTGLDLLVLTGTNPGEITYTFTPTIPPAASYKVWYIAGKKTSSDEIIDKPEASSRSHTDAAITGTTIPDLVPDTEYTFVVVAEKNGLTGYSAVRSAKAKALLQNTTGFTLTVTGLPAAATGKIYGASLMAPTAPDTPVAVAMESSGKFSFYHPKEGSIPIDFTKPFATPGTYVLVIALTNPIDPNNPEAIYSYTQNNGTVTYSDSNKDFTFAWSDFSDNAFVLTVSGDIPTAIVGAAVRENLTGDGKVIAVAMKSGGTFKFYVPDLTIPAIPMPSKTPWTGDGSYPLVLSTALAQQYLYTAGKELTDQTAFTTKFDFTGSNGTASWSDFKQLP